MWAPPRYVFICSPPRPSSLQHRAVSCWCFEMRSPRCEPVLPEPTCTRPAPRTVEWCSPATSRADAAHPRSRCTCVVHLVPGDVSPPARRDASSPTRAMRVFGSDWYREREPLQPLRRQATARRRRCHRHGGWSSTVAGWCLEVVAMACRRSTPRRSATSRRVARRGISRHVRLRFVILGQLRRRLSTLHGVSPHQTIASRCRMCSCGRRRLLLPSHLAVLFVTALAIVVFPSSTSPHPRRSSGRHDHVVAPASPELVFRASSFSLVERSPADRHRADDAHPCAPDDWRGGSATATTVVAAGGGNIRRRRPFPRHRTTSMSPSSSCRRPSTALEEKRAASTKVAGASP